MSDYNILINTCIKDLFLAHAGDQKVTIEDVDINEGIIREKAANVNEMSLEVTENCNLECKYCVYGSGHYVYGRKKTSYNMS